jgi:hypothetical protein
MKERLKRALEALEYWDVHGKLNQPTEEAITAIKAALAQPAQEPVAWSAYEYDGIHHKPVAWMDRDGNFSDNNDHKCFPIPLYTITYPSRPWVGLTEAQFLEAVRLAENGNYLVAFVRIQEWLKEKNT